MSCDLNGQMTLAIDVLCAAQLCSIYPSRRAAIEHAHTQVLCTVSQQAMDQRASLQCSLQNITTPRKYENGTAEPLGTPCTSMSPAESFVSPSATPLPLTAASPRKEGRLDDRRHVSSTTCSICIEEFVPGERVRVLPRCRHVFHTECILPWLTERQGCCPMCKEPVLPEELQRRSQRRSVLGARSLRRRRSGSGGRASAGRRPPPQHRDSDAATASSSAAVILPSDTRSEVFAGASRHDNHLPSEGRSMSEIENDVNSAPALPVTPDRSSWGSVVPGTVALPVAPDGSSRNSVTPVTVATVGTEAGGAYVESGFSTLRQDRNLIALEQDCPSRTSLSRGEADSSG